MIKSFKHKGLRKLFENDDPSKISADHVEKIRRILARLEGADDVKDMSLPGYRLHPLKGPLSGFWAVSVSGNWRLIFRFEDGNAFDVDLVDYH